MQQHLTSQELAEHFTSLPQEQAPGPSEGINQLGIAVLLKYSNGRPLSHRRPRDSPGGRAAPGGDAGGTGRPLHAV